MCLFCVVWKPFNCSIVKSREPGSDIIMNVTSQDKRQCQMVVLHIVFLLSFTGWAAGSTHSHQPWEEHIGRLHPSSSPQQQEDAVKGMLQRLLGNRAADFDIKVDPDIGFVNMDRFKITAQNGTAQITGSTGVAASSGVLYYLKYYCFCHVSWEADQLDLPEKLPDASFVRTAPERFRYYFNICTLSYSTPWWTWKEWERGIDWMALNGINLVLAPTGQEDVWRRTFLSLGLTDDDLKGFFAGPPFLAWNRMGNIRGWGGPLTQDWMLKRSALNKQIVGRMREFGILPILPAFAGHVPEGLQRLYPSANITRLSAWGHFTDPYTRTFFLDPRDPLFNTIGSNFIQKVNQTFGTDHLYNCDPFNEMTPVSSDPTYLQSLGSAVLGAMTDVDPLAVWVMQGWMFVNNPGFWQPEQTKALLTSVPQGRLLILDLAAETLPQYRRFESFYGQPFIFCMLHNYGGVQGLFGNVNVLLKHLQAARANTTTNITIVGTGMTPEGINQNYIMYDLFSELMWITEINVPLWAQNYAKRRYGSSDTRLGEAWQLLMHSVYDCQTLMYNHGQYILVTRPDVNRSMDELWYSVTDVVKAWDLIMAVANGTTENTQTPSVMYPSQASSVSELEKTTTGSSRHHLGHSLLLKRLENLVDPGPYLEAEMVRNKNWKIHDGLKRKKRSSGFIIQVMNDWRVKYQGDEVKESCSKKELEEKREVTVQEQVNWSRWEGRADETQGRRRNQRQGKSVQEQETFKHDVVDITRQMLQLIGGNFSLRLIDDYKNGVLLALRESSKILQDLLSDMDSLLASSPAFLLGPWIDGAASWASNDQERNQLVVNALHQITLWGPTGEILDYAIKQWSGIFSDYLRGRWALFAERLEDSLLSHKPFDQPSFNFEVYEKVERKFAKNVNASFPTQPTGNTLDLALQLYRKYRSVFNSQLLTDFSKQYRRTIRRIRDKK